MGDLGGSSAPELPSSLKDRRAEERAIRMGWAVPDDVRIQILKRLAGIVDPETEEGASAELRYVIQAARTIASADLRQQAIDLAREQAAVGKTIGTLAELTAEAEKRAAEHRADRGQGANGQPPGGMP